MTNTSAMGPSLLSSARLAKCNAATKPKIKLNIEHLVKPLLLLAALVAIVAVVLIGVYIFMGGIPALKAIGLIKFITGVKWHPELGSYGILPMILGSLAVTMGALVLGVPIALLTAIYLSRYCPPKLKNIGHSLIDLLAGIPSVVYGFFALTTIVPIVGSIFGGTGASVLSACIVLALMIVPTIASVTISSLEALPTTYMESSLALGASKERSIFIVEAREAFSGILSSIVLGAGRAIGETMAVIMVAGNQALIPRGLFYGARTLTSNIALEMGYATGLHRGALLATGVVLFTLCLIVNALLLYVSRDKSAKSRSCILGHSKGKAHIRAHKAVQEEGL